METRKKARERKKLKFLFLTIGFVFIAAVSQAQASWEIYNDTDIHSGTYGLIDIYDSPPDNTTVNFYGDLADYIGTHDSSILNFFSGEAELQAMDTSTINISGGTLSSVWAWDDAIVNFSETSEATALSARNSCTINMTGGTIEGVAGRNYGIVNLHAGVISDYISAHDSSVINIYGNDLVKTSSGGTYGYGQVYGFWIDDTSFLIDLGNAEAYEHVNLIPEPTAFTLFVIGSLVLLRKNNYINNRKYS